MEVAKKGSQKEMQHWCKGAAHVGGSLLVFSNRGPFGQTRIVYCRRLPKTPRRILCLLTDASQVRFSIQKRRQACKFGAQVLTCTPTNKCVVCDDLYRFHKRSGSHVHFCPHPPPTQKTTLSARSVPSRLLWPCSHRLYVIAWRLGCHHWRATLMRLHIQTHLIARLGLFIC